MSGELTAGAIEAASLDEARSQLRQRNLFALKLDATTPIAGAVSGIRMDSGRVSKTDLLMLTNQLSIMCQTGVDLAESLRIVAEQCGKPALKFALETIYQDVSNGESASAALQRQVHIFGPTYVAGVAAGEASGQVPEVLRRMAEMLRNEIRLRSTLRSVLAYPAVLVFVAVGVIGALIFFVLPQFAHVFEDLEAAAPPLTQFLLDGSLTVRTHLLPILLLSGAGACLLIRLSRTSGARWYWDGLILNGVLIRNATRSLYIGRVFRLMGTMLESGVPLLEAVRLCRSSIDNTHFQRFFDSVEEDILNGRGLQGAVAAASFVPAGAAQMVHTAERTGKLAPVMHTIGVFYEDEGERLVREYAKLLEPAVIIGMGVIVAVVVLSVMLPLLDFSTISS